MHMHRATPSTAVCSVRLKSKASSAAFQTSHYTSRTQGSSPGPRYTGECGCGCGCLFVCVCECVGVREKRCILCIWMQNSPYYTPYTHSPSLSLSHTHTLSLFLSLSLSLSVQVCAHQQVRAGQNPLLCAAGWKIHAHVLQTQRRGERTDHRCVCEFVCV
jgi:hypothetical protein